MSAQILRFTTARNVIWLMPSRDDPGAWLVLHGSYGWLHGSSAAADDDAAWLSANTGLPIRTVSSS